MDPHDRYQDMLRYSSKCPEFLSTGVFGIDGPSWIYPPAAMPAFCSFFYVEHPLRWLTAMTLGVMAFGVGALRWASCAYPHSGLVLLTAVISAATSYPFLYDLDRANLEALILLFVSLGLIAFLRGNYLACALFFSIATCIKPFPVAFFYLMLKRKRYREIAIGAALILVVNLIALKNMGPDIAANWATLQVGVRDFTTHYALSIHPMEIGFDHSLFSAIKQVVRLNGNPPLASLDALFARVSGPYTVAALAVGAACALRIWRMPLVNQVFVLTLLAILFPYVSYDYTLLELYLPWGLFILLIAHNQSAVSKRDALLVLVPCAVIFTPQTFLIIGRFTGVGGQVKAMALLFLLVVVVRIPLGASDWGAGVWNTPPERVARRAKRDILQG